VSPIGTWKWRHCMQPLKTHAMLLCLAWGNGSLVHVLWHRLPAPPHQLEQLAEADRWVKNGALEASMAYKSTLGRWPKGQRRCLLCFLGFGELQIAEISEVVVAAMIADPRAPWLGNGWNADRLRTYKVPSWACLSKSQVGPAHLCKMWPTWWTYWHKGLNQSF